MKDLMRKPIAIILAILIAAGGTGIGVYAVAENNSRQQTVSDNAAKEEKQEEKKPEANVKDETVYILSEADGSIRKIIVSDWLKNVSGSTKLSDSSDFSGIVNVKSDNGFTSEESGTTLWDAQGEDIYYTGEINKELPITLSVKYYLDGTELSPEEMKGKSGKAVIRFEYINNQYETVKVDGRDEKIYVPFAVLTGAMLDNDIFRNVEVSNGKIINDGDRTVVVGTAFPGMQSNLDIDSDKLEIPDYFEITADVDNFEMSETVTVATNEIFNNIELEGVGSLDELDESLRTLDDAADQLSDGSDKLYDGLNTLLEKSSELIEGIDKLVEGADALKDGTLDLADGSSQLSEGAGQLSDGSKQLAEGSKQVSDGSKELSSGLDAISQNSAALCAGSKQVFDTLLTAATAQLREAGLTVPDLTIENYSQVLEQVLSSLDEASVNALAKETAEKKVTEAVRERESEIAAAVIEAVKAEVLPKVEAAVRENVEAQVLASQGLDKEQYEAAVNAGLISKDQQAQISAAVNAQMNTDTVKSIIDQNLEEQMQSAEIKNIISQNIVKQEQILINQNLNSNEVKAQINEAAAKAKAGRESITSLIGQLDSYNEFYTGLTQYTDGVDQAAQGASQLRDGAASLNDGANTLNSGVNDLKAGADALKDGAVRLDNGAEQLYEGLLTLKNSVPALLDGITQLRDGARDLSEGMKEFKEQGIQKLIDAVDGDLSGLIDRLKATVEVSERYNSFSGISEDMEGSVKFIYRTDGVK